MESAKTLIMRWFLPRDASLAFGRGAGTEDARPSERLNLKLACFPDDSTL